MSTIGLLLVLSLAPQDSLRELLQQLDDDSSQVREQATRKLGDLEPGSLGALRDAALTASAEAKPRLLQAIRRIENRQVLRSKLRPASLVSLEARDQPWREVLAALVKQGSTPVRADGISDDQRVTVSLSKLPFWEALHRACTAREGIRYEVDADTWIRAGGVPSEARRFAGPFATFFLGADVGTEISLRFVTCWEEGIKPDGISFRFKEIKDDRGNDLLGDDADPFTGESGSDLAHSYDRSFRSRTLPDPGASKLSRLWLQAGVHFTLRSATATFKDANLADGCTLTSDELSVRLEKFEERDGQASGSLLVGIPEGRFVPSDLIRIALKEEGGKETRIGAPSLRDGRLQVAFCAGGAPQKLGKIAELRITLPTEVHTETVELDFRDLPLKR